MAITLLRERAMTNRSKIVSLASLAAAFSLVAISPAAAELQECFRDGYLCSVTCDKAHLDKDGSAACQAQCNADEKVCLAQVSAERRPGAIRHSPAATAATLRPLNAVRQAAR